MEEYRELSERQTPTEANKNPDTKQLIIADVSNHVFCPYCGHKRGYIVTTDINSGKECKNPLCKGK